MRGMMFGEAVGPGVVRLLVGAGERGIFVGDGVGRVVGLLVEGGERGILVGDGVLERFVGGGEPGGIVTNLVGRVVGFVVGAVWGSCEGISVSSLSGAIGAMLGNCELPESFAPTFVGAADGTIDCAGFVTLPSDIGAIGSTEVVSLVARLLFHSSSGSLDVD